MGLKIINGEHMICSCKKEDIPKWVTKHGKAEDVAFFYYHERDAIVLNEDNVNYEFYLTIIGYYVEFNDMQRKEFKEKSAEVNYRVVRSIGCLNYMLRIRRKLYKSMTRKAGASNVSL